MMGQDFVMEDPTTVRMGGHHNRGVLMSAP